MQCRSCGYTLFNLTEPRCPECNTPFDVTTYGFEPGSVQFGCPYCEQLYEGNDAQGLPYPRQFECVNCHLPVDVQNMRVVPVTDGAMVGPGVGPGVPWELPEEGGWLSRWWVTCKLGMFQPTTYYRRLRYVDDLGKAISFAAICFVISGALSGLIEGSIGLALAGGAGGATGKGPAAFFTSAVGQMVVQALLAVPLGLLGLFVGGATIHIGVRIFARDKREYRNTVVVLAYASCPAVWALIPFLGSLAAALWTLIIGIVGISVMHRTTIGGAVCAYFALPVIVVLTVSVIMMVLMLAM